MDLTAAGTLISTVGFPIAMVLIMVWMVMKFNDDYRTEVSELRKAVENNTTAIVQLTAYIMKDRDDEQD